MKLIKFLFSKVFFLNLLIAGVLLLGGYFYLDSYLEKITNHGEKVVVPSVKKMNINKVGSALEEGGFRYEVMDSTWERGLPKGIVLEQKPAPGDSVKEGRKIYVTINARSDKMVKLSMEGMIGGTSHAREAIDYLITNDLVHGPNVAVPGQYDGMFLGFVDEKGKDLHEGDLVKAGATISIKVSVTDNAEIRMPKVKGKTLKEAVRILKENLLNVNPVELQDRACFKGLDSNLAIIQMQRPDCGKDIKVGREVTLFYSCDSTRKVSMECK
jgi:beta-lactam-binding protein with PASTA domain